MPRAKKIKVDDFLVYGDQAQYDTISNLTTNVVPDEFLEFMRDGVILTNTYHPQRLQGMTLGVFHTRNLTKEQEQRAQLFLGSFVIERQILGGIYWCYDPEKMKFIKEKDKSSLKTQLDIRNNVRFQVCVWHITRGIHFGVKIEEGQAISKSSEQLARISLRHRELF